MSTDTKTLALSPQAFRKQTTAIAHSLLKDWVGEERAKEATGRIAVSLSASASAARNPTDFYLCTPESVAKVIAISALTGIMVGNGASALAYAIPRRPRKEEAPQLQYQLSHRGIAALAMRAGLALVAYPISTRDVVDVDEAGEVVVISRDIDNPPETEDDFRGVMVMVRSVSTGVVLSRGFVAKKVINRRRLESDSYRFAANPKNKWAQTSDPWHKWYVEMSIKTAMHYAVSRGWCVIDDTEAVRALAADTGEEDRIGYTEPQQGNRTAALEHRLSDMNGHGSETTEPKSTIDADAEAIAKEQAEIEAEERAGAE